MSKHVSYTARVIADTGCSAHGITSRHKSLTVIGYGFRHQPEVLPLEGLKHLDKGTFNREDWAELAGKGDEALVALVAYGSHLYLNPVRFDERLGRFVLVTGTMSGGNYVNGDSRFSMAATALLNEVAPATLGVHHSYPLAVHDRIEH